MVTEGVVVDLVHRINHLKLFILADLGWLKHISIRDNVFVKPYPQNISQLQVQQCLFILNPNYVYKCVVSLCFIGGYPEIAKTKTSGDVEFASSSQKTCPTTLPLLRAGQGLRHKKKRQLPGNGNSK